MGYGDVPSGGVSGGGRLTNPTLVDNGDGTCNLGFDYTADRT